MTKAAFFAVLTGLLGVVACGPASGATPSFGGNYHVDQYSVNQWPLFVVDDETSPNPNWFHIRDQGFQPWGEDPAGLQNGVPQIRWDRNLAAWPNRVQYTFVEQQLDGYNCFGSSGPRLAGCTNTTATWQYDIGAYRVTSCVTRLDVDRRADPVNSRLELKGHEIGHCWGLTHDDQGTGIMEPVVRGDWPNPTNLEHQAVYNCYHGAGCVGSTSGVRSYAVPDGTAHPPLVTAFPDMRTG